MRKLQEARPKIAKLGAPFILDGHKILTHSKSRVVLQMLIEAAQTSKKRFHVFVTESYPDQSGVLMRDELVKNNISATLILDSAMGYVMESVDLVLVGAEGVVESGGIINKVQMVFLNINRVCQFIVFKSKDWNVYYGSLCQRNAEALLRSG